ncbi:retrovirus-related pol polyprotein from transposon TNT 1-94 [Tanacetum coccineum]
MDENSTLWHMRLGYANMRLIQSLASKELVRNLPKLKFDQHFCDDCKIGKQAHASHKAKNIVSTTRCLELLHIDLFVIIEYLVKISKKAHIMELKRRHLKITVLTTNTPYHQGRYGASVPALHKRPRRKQDQYAVTREDQYTVFKLWK